MTGPFPREPASLHTNSIPNLHIIYEIFVQHNRYGDPTFHFLLYLFVLLRVATINTRGHPLTAICKNAPTKIRHVVSIYGTQ